LADYFSFKDKPAAKRVLFFIGTDQINFSGFFRQAVGVCSHMKTGSYRGIHTLAMVIFPLCFALLARGQNVTMIVDVESDTLTTGDSMSVWMTALDTTADNISWTFPPEIKSKFISGQGTFDGSLALHSTETNAVVLAPGTFARREYIAAVPDSISGQVVLEFPGLDVNRTVMDIEARTTTAEPANAASPTNHVIVR